MFTFGFLTIFFFIVIIPDVKVHCMSQIANLRTEDSNFFLSSFQENLKVPNYDIGRWVQQLHLQQCAFVEIGEGFCALFVELQNIPQKSTDTQTAEFFLGICDCSTLRSWILCSPELFEMRKSDCIFTEATVNANTSARVHRRLCDVTFISSVAPNCNCSIQLANEKLYSTEGFPTCFLNPLPNSICSPRGVCGVAGCTVRTIKGIYSPQCDPNCHQKQPFCEDLGPWTSVPPRITSLWSKWSNPKCNVTCGRGSLFSTSFCYNQVTGENDIDCIGPGSFCCPHASEMCECKVTIKNGIMKARRFTEPCTSSESCPAIIKERYFLPESQFEESKDYGVDDEYEEFDQENFGGKLLSEASNEYEEPVRVSRRLLENVDDINYYEIMRNDDDDKEFEENENNERMVAIDEDLDDDDIEYDPDMEDSDEEVQDVEEEEGDDANHEDDEEYGDDDMMTFRKTKGRSDQIEHDRILRSDDEATFTRRPRFLGFPFMRKKPHKKPNKKRPKEFRDCEDPSVTERPIYRDYDPENSSEHSSKPQTSLLVLILFVIISITIFSFG